MVKGKSQVTTPSPPGFGAPASEEKPGESSLRDIALSSQQEQISELMDMVKSMHARLELQGLDQTGPRASVPVDQHSNSSLAGVRRPLPSLSDMTKGLSADSHFSGKDTDQEGIWDEWLAKIRPSLRHPSLAPLLSELTPPHMLRGDDSYLEEANQLFYDFHCRDTTGTANAIVRSYEPYSNGHGAWLALSKLRRNTSVVYLINQVDKLFLLTNQLSSLAPPLSTFLESKETLRRIHEYSVNARVTPSGKLMCMETVETMYSAMAIVRLHPDYMLLKAKFMVESLPTVDVLSDQVTSHYDTILAPRAAVTHTAHAVSQVDDKSESETAGAIAADRRKQEETKRQRLAAKVPCPVCQRCGHPSKDCFIKNVEKREAFFKKASPTTKEAILKRVADYEKHGSLPKPGEHLGDAAGQSELYPGLEESGEVLFALREACQPALHPGLDETDDDDSDCSIPDLDSASDSDSDDDGYVSDTMPDLEDASDSDEEEDMNLGQPVEGVGHIPSNDWASGLFCPPHKNRLCSVDLVPDDYYEDHCDEDFGDLVTDLGLGYDSCDVDDQSQSVNSSGSGFVTFAKRDVRSGRMIGLRLLGTHCIPGQPFNLLSVVALEDAGFLVDFGARIVSKGGAVFPFARVGNQYIMHEDNYETLDTHLACAAKHTDDQRDRFDWKFEDTKPHFTTHGPLLLELFSSDDNHILDDYCTLADTCFAKDWAGRHCYGNPPFDHDIILKCLHKALTDFERDPPNTKFMFILPKSCYNVANLEPCGEDRVWIEDTKWPVVVLFKASHTEEQLDIKMLQHVRLTKAIRPSVKPTGRELSKELGNLIWSDTCGPFRTSVGGYRWFVLFVDDSTTWICIFFLKLKSDYLKAFKLYLVQVKRLRSIMGLPSEYHMVLHTDGDSTMIAGQTSTFCTQQGIEQRRGSPYLHENQARVERSHRDVQAMATALLLTSGFGVDMWPLATRHAVYILNRVFRKSLGWTSAYYLIQQKHADLSQLRVYVGHSEVSSAYLLCDPESGKVVNSSMVTFSERLDKLGRVVTRWDPSAVAPLKTDFMTTSLDAPYRDPPPTLLETAALEQGVYLPEGVDEVVAVVKVETSDDVCWDELEALVQIKKALLMMDEEDVPTGVKLLDMSLVLKVKVDKHRQLLKRKSRICVRGNKQEYGVDYYDTFAPCTQLSSVRIVITLALNLGLMVYHMDLDIAFLKSVLEEDLYVRLPRGLVYGGHRCAKLLKAVYGLKQAGREWFDTSDAFIMGYDSRMQRSDVEPCLYFIRDSTLQVIILAYVDDYLVATNDKSWYDTFVTTFHSQYACKDLGVLDLVMGIGVRWGSGTACLSQSGYISQMINTYGLDDAKPASLPMSPGTALAVADGKGSELYRALLGQCLGFVQWVARCSRPDIMAAVSVLSRFCATYGPDHFVALKQVVWYLKGTINYELNNQEKHILNSCLSLWESGHILLLDSLIQKCVSLSTTEDEIIAMSEGAREVKYVLNVLDSLVNICRPVPLYCDNQGAIHLATDYVNNSRSKHIEVRNMYIRELIKAKEAEALYTGTDDNTSDIMTKPLALPIFRVHRERLGVMNQPRGDQ
eukprot:gene34034-biopygen5441